MLTTATERPAQETVRDAETDAAPAQVQEIVRAYDRYARIYDVLFGWVLQGGRSKLGRILRSRNAAQILEIGVGSGLMLPLYPRSAQVLGVDVSPGMLACARQRVERLGLTGVELRLVNGESGELPTGGFDHVVLPYVYSVTPDPFRLMEEAFRCCRPGGTVWVLNHFSGLGGWRTPEAMLRPFARVIGFRPEFPYETYVKAMDWDIVAEYRVNLFSLSRLIEIRTPGVRTYGSETGGNA